MTPIAPAMTMTGTKGVLPANRVCFCGSNRVQKASQSMPATAIASHQYTMANNPNMPTESPTINVEVTSPNPKVPGLTSASEPCNTADSTANSSACNTRNSELKAIAYAVSAMICARQPKAIHTRGTRRDRTSSMLAAVPQSRLGRQIMYHIPLR